MLVREKEKIYTIYDKIIYNLPAISKRMKEANFRELAPAIVGNILFISVDAQFVAHNNLVPIYIEKYLPLSFLLSIIFVSLYIFIC